MRGRVRRRELARRKRRPLPLVDGSRGKRDAFDDGLGFVGDDEGGATHSAARYRGKETSRPKEDREWRAHFPRHRRL